MRHGNHGRLQPRRGQGSVTEGEVKGRRTGGAVARQETEAPSAKLCVLTSQLEKSNSCAIVLHDFNSCKNSECFLRVSPMRAEAAPAPSGVSEGDTPQRCTAQITSSRTTKTHTTSSAHLEKAVAHLTFLSMDMASATWKRIGPSASAWSARIFPTQTPLKGNVA